VHPAPPKSAPTGNSKVPPPAHAGNIAPRPVTEPAPGKPQTPAAKPAAPLSYPKGAVAPSAANHRPGSVDAGGYSRPPQNQHDVIQRTDLHTQCLHLIPDHDNICQHNQQYWRGDVSHWPCQWRPRPEWGAWNYFEQLWLDEEVYDILTEFGSGGYCPGDYCPTSVYFVVSLGQFWCPVSGTSTTRRSTTTSTAMVTSRSTTGR